MEKRLKKIASSAFWQRRPVQAALGVLSFGMAYALGSFAVDSGNLFQWALALFWIGVGVRQLACAVLPRKAKGLGE